MCSVFSQTEEKPVFCYWCLAMKIINSGLQFMLDSGHKSKSCSHHFTSPLILKGKRETYFLHPSGHIQVLLLPQSQLATMTLHVHKYTEKYKPGFKQVNMHCLGVLTARYCGPSELRPVKFPHMEAAFSCCICCCSCWAMRFCSLSFCVSANFTTIGEEQPWAIMYMF